MIMSGYDSWEVRLAWQIARQIRGCPPDTEVLAERVDEELAAHLEICAYCQDFRRSGPAAKEMLELAGHFGRPVTSSPQPPLEKGQIRAVRESLAGWGPKRLFYNPPLVLVLGVKRELAGAVRVSQIYDDPRLIGPGDVLLGDGLFAETWNSYTLRESYLQGLVATVSPYLVAEVLDLEAKPFPDLEKHSVLKAFRRFELEVGAFFSIQAVSELMAQVEPGLGERLLTRFGGEQTIVTKIREQQPGILWPRKSLPLLETLALARFPEDELPLAASGEEKVVSANVLHLHLEQGELFLHSSLASISVWREQEQGFLVGGRIEEDLREEAELTARFELPDGTLIEAQKAFIDPETGHFGAFFADLDADDIRDFRFALLVLTG
jgi:hypothetical protein